VSFDRSIANLLEYRRTRFPLARFLPLALFLGLAASTADEHTSVGFFAVRVLLVFLWLFQFRLGDDLADRQRDRRDHPDRVLVRAEGRPFAWLLAILTAGNMLMTYWQLSVSRSTEFIGLVGLFLLWYGIMRCWHFPLLTSVGVLLKYPAFVYLLSDPSESVSRSTMIEVVVLVYACVLTHEFLHEKRLWRMSGISIYLALSMLLMTAAAVWLMRLNAQGSQEWWLFGALGMGCVVLAWLFYRHWLRRELGPWPDTVFLVTGLWLTCCYLR